MSVHLQREIERLKKGVLSLCALVEQQVEMAVRALLNRDPDLARSVEERDVEIDVKTLMERARGVKEVRTHVDEVTMPGGKRVYLVGKGRIANLVAAEGHPPEVMQMSFANQFMAALYIKKNHSKLENRIYGVPEEVEREIAYATLDSLGIVISEPTEEQAEYAQSWTV